VREAGRLWQRRAREGVARLCLWGEVAGRARGVGESFASLGVCCIIVVDQRVEFAGEDDSLSTGEPHQYARFRKGTQAMKRLILIAVVVFLSACTSSSLETPTQVPTEAPASTPTPIPLSEINLESILVESGDLPATISPGQVRDFPPVEVEVLGETRTSALYRFVDTMPAPDGSVYLELHSSETDIEGGVTVFLYEAEDYAETAYTEIAAYMQESEPYVYESSGDSVSSVSDVGNAAIAVDMGSDLNFVHFSAFAFRRCHAVVHIVMRGGDVDQSTGYAQRLDQRLQPLVCR
jgi:hypothetical protein